jgi:hypothetical protein
MSKIRRLSYLLMDALGIEADLRYPGAQTTYTSIPHFFRVKLAEG